MTPRESAAEALEKAAGMLESGMLAWRRGDYDDGMSVCAVGALCRATGETWHKKHPVATWATEYIRPHVVFQLMKFFEGIHGVTTDKGPWDGEGATITFNDRVAESVADVVEVMKLAAKDARNEA